ELDLLVGGQQRVARHLVEEELERVGRGDCQVAVDIRALVPPPPAVVAYLDVAGSELLADPLDLLVVKLQRLDELVQLREVDTPSLRALVEEGTDPVRAHRSTSSFHDRANF